ncbi:MAG: beta-N-acetylhexosaminidase [Acidobacteriaceae bacterium]
MFASHRIAPLPVDPRADSPQVSGQKFSRHRVRFLAMWVVLLPLLIAARAVAETSLALIPYPQHVEQSNGTLVLPHTLTIRADNADDRFAANTLVEELLQMEHIHASVQDTAGSAQITLARLNTPEGRQILQGAGLVFPAAAQEEGYALVVNAHQAAVVASSSAGIFYGVQTLRQLLHPEQNRATVPLVKIMDWPALRWRGSQVSLSQGAVPTLQDLEHAVRLLAAYKQNLLMLYFENTFDYPSLPLDAMPGGGMTPAEARELIAFARNYHITIIPEQESIGHLHQVLHQEKYTDITEVPYGTVLTPTSPGSLPFVMQMLSELVHVFPGPFIHIGADETFELGQGRTKQLIAQKGKGQVYLDFMKQIDSALDNSHRRVLFWGDIAQHYPDLLDQIPHNMLAVAWNYKDLSPSQFEAMIEPFRKVGLETWVAPGVDNWNNIFPNYTVALPNIRVFTEVGRRMGITGMMNTTWNDDGETLFDATWYGLVYGSAVGWQNKIDDKQFGDAYDWAFYRAPGHHFQQEIEDMTQIYSVLHTVIPRDGIDSLAWADPFTPDGQKLYLTMAPAAHQMRLLAEQVIADVRTSRPLAKQNADLLDPVEFAARRFDYLGEKAIYTKYIADLYKSAEENQTSNPTVVLDALDRIAASDGLLLDLRNQNSYLMDGYRTLWLAGNHPYFMQNMLLHYQLENLRIAEEIDRFRTLRQDFPTTHCLPPLVHPAPYTCQK